MRYRKASKLAAALKGNKKITGNWVDQLGTCSKTGLPKGVQYEAQLELPTG